MRIRGREFDRKTPDAVWLLFPVPVHFLLCSSQGANISYAPTCTQATDKRDPPAVSELVVNQADSLQTANQSRFVNWEIRRSKS